MPVRAPVTRDRRVIPLVRPVRHLPRILDHDDVIKLVAALRTDRDRAMIDAMLLAGLRRCEVLGLRLQDVRWGERRLFIADGKGGHQRIVPISPRFFDTLRRYLDNERPADAETPFVFVVLKGPNRGRPLTAKGLDEIMLGARRRGGARACDVSRAAPHLFHSAPRGRHGTRSTPGPSRSPIDLSNADLPAPRQRLARRRVHTCSSSR